MGLHSLLCLGAAPSYATAVEAWAVAPVVDLLRSQGAAVWADVEPLTRSGAAR